MAFGLRRRGPTNFQRAADGAMTLIEHLRELRSRLFKASLGVVVGLGIGLFFAQPVQEFINSPYCDFKGDQVCQFNTGSPVDPFLLTLKIGLYVGLLVASPVWLYQLWAFIAPGLHRNERRYTYLFLDPYYQVVSANENDPAAIKPVLQYLTRLKNELGCAAIVTHHESDKTEGAHARRLLGSTYLHGWYEGALFPTRHDGGVFTLEVDALREMGETKTHVLQGKGVGRWEYTPEAQGHTDAAGRRNTQRSQKEIRKASLRELLDSEPGWSNAEYGAALGVSSKTVATYRQELEAEQTVVQRVAGLTAQLED